MNKVRKIKKMIKIIWFDKKILKFFLQEKGKYIK